MMNQQQIQQIVLIILALTGVGHTADASLARVVSINPVAGSYNGGTKVTLFGSGFSDDKFNFGAGREHLGITITWVDDWKHEYVCDIHVEGCTKSKLECYTRAMPVSVYYPRVTMNGDAIPSQNICNDYEGRGCTFVITSPTSATSATYTTQVSDTFTIDHHPRPKRNSPVQKWTCAAVMDKPDWYKGSLNLSPLSVQWEPDTQTATYTPPPQFTELGRYRLKLKCSDKDTFYVLYDNLPTDYTAPELKMEKQVTLVFDGNYTKVVANHNDHFTNMLHNRLFYKIALARKTVFSDWLVSSGSIVASFKVSGESLESIDNTIFQIYDDMTTTSTLEFRSIKLDPAEQMLVDQQIYRFKGGRVALPILNCTISQAETDLYEGKLVGTPDWMQWDQTTKNSSPPLQFTSFARYSLQFECVGKAIFLENYDHLPADYQAPLDPTVHQRLTLQFNKEYAIVGTKETHFMNMLHNRYFFGIAKELKTVLTEWHVTDGSIVTTFTVSGIDNKSVDTTVYKIWQNATTRDELLLFRGHRLGLINTMLVDSNRYDGKYYEDKYLPTPAPDTPFESGYIALITIVSILVLGIIIVVACKVCNPKLSQEESVGSFSKSSRSTRTNSRMASSRQHKQIRSVSGQQVEGGSYGSGSSSGSGSGSGSSSESMNEAGPPATTSWPGIAGAAGAAAGKKATETPRLFTPVPPETCQPSEPPSIQPPSEPTAPQTKTTSPPPNADPPSQASHHSTDGRAFTNKVAPTEEENPLL